MSRSQSITLYLLSTVQKSIILFNAPCSTFLFSSHFDDKMNSILKIFSRQTEHLLRLTKTTIHAYQLQNNLVNNNLNLFDRQDNHPCAFSYDLSHELRLIEKYLHSTCFLLQRALYRTQALRQIRGELPIQIDDDIIIKYQQNLFIQLNYIQQIILSAIDDNQLTNSPLNILQILFKQIQENFQILLDYMYWMPTHKSTIYLGNLVSDTLDKFYSIHNILARIIKDIEQKK